jgi:hypothetical protein
LASTSTVPVPEIDLVLTVSLLDAAVAAVEPESEELSLLPPQAASPRRAGTSAMARIGLSIIAFLVVPTSRRGGTARLRRGIAPGGGRVPADHRRGRYIATAHIRDDEHLEEVIDHFAALGQTTSSIAQSSPVPRRGIDLGADGARPS